MGWRCYFVEIREKLSSIWHFQVPFALYTFAIIKNLIVADEDSSPRKKRVLSDSDESSDDERKPKDVKPKEVRLIIF